MSITYDKAAFGSAPLPRPNLWSYAVHQLRDLLGRREENPVAGLSDHHLIDIGIDPRTRAPAANIDAGRLGLLDLGWQQPRRSLRR